MQKEILIIGASGAIGKRWSAIVKFLGYKPIEIDIKNGSGPWDYLEHAKHTKQVIIATPTKTHVPIAKELLALDCRILCEKPLFVYDQNNLDTTMHMLEGDLQIVNNWSYVTKHPLQIGAHDISYSYFNIGQEDTFSNLFQPLAFAKKLHINTTSPIFSCIIDKERIYRTDFDKSYIRLLANWLDGKQACWGINAYTAAHKQAINTLNGI